MVYDFIDEGVSDVSDCDSFGQLAISDVSTNETQIYGYERAKFDGFGSYKLDIKQRVDELFEICKKEYRDRKSVV